MPKFKLIGLRVSNSANNLKKYVPIDKCVWYNVRRHRGGWSGPGDADYLINYGVQGTRLAEFYTIYPEARGIPTFNGHINRVGNKMNSVMVAKNAGIPAPDVLHGRKSWRDLYGRGAGAARNYSDWIIKPYYSRGGHGIAVWDGSPVPGSHYLQQRVRNRLYEVRVTAFCWIPMDNWGVWKKVREDGEKDENVAWNHEQGGKFITVKEPNKYNVFRECKKWTNELLKALDLHFGAADFIISEDYKVDFLEMNTRPGFSPISERYYIDSFKTLVNMSAEEVEREYRKRS